MLLTIDWVHPTKTELEPRAKFVSRGRRAVGLNWARNSNVLVALVSTWLTFSEAWYGPQTQIFGKMKNTCGEIHLESPKNLAWPNLNKPPNLNLWNKKSWYILSDRRTDILNILNWSWEYCNVISTCKLQALSVTACDVKIQLGYYTYTLMINIWTFKCTKLVKY